MADVFSKPDPPFPRKWEPEIETVPDEAGWVRFLNGLEQHLEDLYAYVEHAHYLQYRDKVDPVLDEVFAMQRATFANERAWDLIEEGARRGWSPLVARRTELLRYFFQRERVAAHPETQRLVGEVMSLFVHQKPRLSDGTEGKVPIQKILRNEPDRERRKEAWYAINTIGREVAPKVRSLTEYRVEVARSMGYATWHEFIYPTYGLTREYVRKTIEELYEKLLPLFKKVRARLAEEAGLDALEPWDVAWAKEQFLVPPADNFPGDTALTALDETLERLGGKRDPLDVPITVAEIPLGGACFDIHIPADLRILVNPREGLLNRSIFFHEYGHALHHSNNHGETYTIQTCNLGAASDTAIDLFDPGLGWMDSDTSGGNTSKSSGRSDASSRSATSM